MILVIVIEVVYVTDDFVFGFSPGVGDAMESVFQIKTRPNKAVGFVPYIRQRRAGQQSVIRIRLISPRALGAGRGCEGCAGADFFVGPV